MDHMIHLSTSSTQDNPSFPIDFFDEATDEVRLSPEDSNELQTLIRFDPRNSKISLYETLQVEKSRYRLKAYSILRKALQNNDHETIKRWYLPELFIGSHLFSPGEMAELNLIVKPPSDGKLIFMSLERENGNP